MTPPVSGPGPVPAPRYVAAVDVGGTALKGALVAADGTTLAAQSRPTGRTDGPDAVVARIAALVGDLAGTARERGAEVAAAGVALPGIVDPGRGVAVFSANLGWHDLPLRDDLAARTGLPVTIGHDVRAGGLAELRLGAARGYADALFVAVGTGIAGALVTGGRLYAGAHFQAGEIGHVVVEPDGAPCGCGAHGCLETVASAAAIARRYAAATGDPVAGDPVAGEPAAEDHATVADVADVADAAEVVRRAGAGDEAAARTVTAAVDALAAALATACALLDPAVVVLGGGLFLAGRTLADPVERGVRAALGASGFAGPDVAVAHLGDRAGCLGAGLLAWDATDASDAAGGRGRCITT